MSNTIKNFIDNSDKNIYLCTMKNGTHNIESIGVDYDKLLNIAYSISDDSDIDEITIKLLELMNKDDFISFYIHHSADTQASKCYIVKADSATESITECLKGNDDNVLYIGSPHFPADIAEAMLNRIDSKVTSQILGHSLYSLNKDIKEKRDERTVIKWILFDDDSVTPYLPDNFDIIDSGIDYGATNIYGINEDINKRLNSIRDMDLSEDEKEEYKNKLHKMQNMLCSMESELHNKLNNFKNEIDNLYELKNEVLSLFGTPSNTYTNFGSYGNSYNDYDDDDDDDDNNEVDDSKGGYDPDDFICRLFTIDAYQFHNPVWNHDEILDNPNAKVEYGEDITAEKSENPELDKYKLTAQDLSLLVDKAKSI